MSRKPLTLTLTLTLFDAIFGARWREERLTLRYAGIQGKDAMYSWFSTVFKVPESWSERVLLNFAAVDYEATVFVNGHNAGFHRGGYFAFTLDVTDHLKDGDNDLYSKPPPPPL